MHRDLKVITLNRNQSNTFMQVHPAGKVIYKGVNPNVDSYSAFFDNQKLSKTCLEELIIKEDVTDLYVCGIATDVCVGREVLIKYKILYILVFSFNCLPRPGARVQDLPGGGRQQGDQQ